MIWFFPSPEKAGMQQFYLSCECNWLTCDTVFSFICATVCQVVILFPMLEVSGCVVKKWLYRKRYKNNTKKVPLYHARHLICRETGRAFWVYLLLNHNSRSLKAYMEDQFWKLVCLKQQKRNVMNFICLICARWHTHASNTLIQCPCRPW